MTLHSSVQSFLFFISDEEKMQLRILRYANAPLDYVRLGKMMTPLLTKSPSSIDILYLHQQPWNYLSVLLQG